MSESAAKAQKVLSEADMIHSPTAVKTAYDRLAAEIELRLAGSNPVVLCVLLGGLVPTGQLLCRLNFPLQLDYIHATRYRGGTQGDQLQWLARPRISLVGRTVLVIDDILDKGVTLAGILDDCRNQGANEVFSAVLIDKKTERAGLERADFSGLVVPDRYVFGCGMDYFNYLRNAPGVYAVKGM